jgi:hypothetical protein
VLAAGIAVVGVFTWGITHIASRNGVGFIVISLLGAFLLLRGLMQEYPIVYHCGIATGEVVDRQIVDTSMVAGQRYVSSRWAIGCEIKYRFAASDGKFYHGVISANSLPGALLGDQIEMVYDLRNPAKNMLRGQLSFYRVPEA